MPKQIPHTGNLASPLALPASIDRHAFENLTGEAIGTIQHITDVLTMAYDNASREQYQSVCHTVTLALRLLYTDMAKRSDELLGFKPHHSNAGVNSGEVQP